MNSILNLFYLIIFSIFLFYWFQNIIKKKERYLYVPYSSVSYTKQSEIEEIQDDIPDDIPEVNKLLKVNFNLELEQPLPLIFKKNIFEPEWDNYL